MKPRLGVLIPYYNEKEMIRECLDSLLANGRGRPEEILIYDDASSIPPDSYVPAGQNIRVIRGKSNQGPAHARNVLLEASQSDYIHFQDADDLFYPDWYRRTHALLAETKADAVFTEISSIFENGSRFERILQLNRLIHGEDLIRFCLHGSLLAPAGTYRRKVVLSINGYRENLWQSEDFDFHVRLAAKNIRYELILDPLILIRVRSGSRSQKQREVWISKLEALQALFEELSPQYRRDLAEEAVRTGSKLYQLGATLEARQAFRFARNSGPVTYADRNPLYRLIAQWIGPEAAEYLGMWYRGVIPKKVKNCLSNLNL